MCRRGDFQLALPLSFEPEVIRAANPGADRETCGSSATVRVVPVLATIQGPAATVLPFKGMEKFINIGQASSPFLYREQASPINATCAPHQALVQSSVAWPSQIEYQRDMFEVSQGGA